MSRDQALDGVNPACPNDVLKCQLLINVEYYSFDGKLHSGQIVANKCVVEDIIYIFDMICEVKFPIFSAIPLSHFKFRENSSWCDRLSMEANNTSCFNFREILYKKKLSYHAFGLAIDINPVQNVYIRDGEIHPSRGSYNPNIKGTLTRECLVTQKFISLGWKWGGGWTNPIDYQHFEKHVKNYL